MNFMTYIKLLPQLAFGGMVLYTIHVDSMHRADKRTIEALRGEMSAIRQQQEGTEEALMAARVDRRRLEGLQADLAGTRSYLKQVESVQRAQAVQLQACRRELRDVSSRFASERRAWSLMPSRQGGGQ